MSKYKTASEIMDAAGYGKEGEKHRTSITRTIILKALNEVLRDSSYIPTAPLNDLLDGICAELRIYRWYTNAAWLCGGDNRWRENVAIFLGDETIDLEHTEGDALVSEFATFFKGIPSLFVKNIDESYDCI